MIMETHYYLINGKVMKGSDMPEQNGYPDFEQLTSKWLNSLQPCEISESELDKVIINIPDNLLQNDIIDVTDIVEEIYCKCNCGESFIEFKQLSDNNGVITFKEKEQRYIVDIRSGCGAIIDTNHKDYNKDYPGLHQDTGGVVEYRHGFRVADRWDMKKEDIEYLNNLCDTLNKHPKQVDGEIEAVEFAEWLRNDWQPLAPNKNDWKNNKHYEICKTTELYEIFKNRK